MSLAFRLGAFFLVALALLLGGFSVALYLLARAQLRQHLDERLANVQDALASAAEIEPDAIEWRPALQRSMDLAPAGEAPISWAAFDEHGNLLDRSGAADFSQALRALPQGGRVRRSLRLGDDRWRVAVHHLRPAQSPGERATGRRRAGPRHGESSVSVHASLTLVTGAREVIMESALVRVGFTLAGLSTLLWFLAAAAGLFVGRRVLSPVTRMASTAASMTANDRTQRLPSPGTRDELEVLADSFNGLLGRLHEALERQERFTGDASHQLRTPLTALISEIELARRRDRPPEEYRRVLDSILGDAVRLRQIVESLLFLARSDAESERPALESVELSLWLRDHLCHWENHPRAGDLHCETLEESPAWVKIHPPLLSQLVDNLLDNACKYSNPGTPVVIRLVHEPGAVALSVEDQGMGIEPLDLPHLFDPFFRSARARLRGTTGSGLGLSVVQRIAQTFGGRVTAESELGSGSRFVVHIPTIPSAMPAPSAV